MVYVFWILKQHGIKALWKKKEVLNGFTLYNLQFMKKQRSKEFVIFLLDAHREVCELYN